MLFEMIPTKHVWEQLGVVKVNDNDSIHHHYQANELPENLLCPFYVECADLMWYQVAASLVDSTWENHRYSKRVDDNDLTVIVPVVKHDSWYIFSVPVSFEHMLVIADQEEKQDWPVVEVEKNTLKSQSQVLPVIFLKVLKYFLMENILSWFKVLFYALHEAKGKEQYYLEGELNICGPFDTLTGFKDHQIPDWHKRNRCDSLTN